MKFDEEAVEISAEPPGRSSWTQEFSWKAVERIVFQAEGPYTSDGIYVFTSDRPESYVVPTEADGAAEFWNEVIRRGLFDPELAIKAATSTEGVFAWPPTDN